MRVKVPFKQLSYPLLFALVAFILIIWLYPLPFTSPYQLKILEHYLGKGLFEYHDLNRDGESELYHVGYNRFEDNSFPFVRISKGFDSKPMVLEQINYQNPKLTYRATTMVGDYDKNNLKEYYTFTVRDSNLFIEAFEYRDDPTDIIFFLNRQIAQINKYKGEYDLNIAKDYIFSDLNHDGFKEFIFILNGLYTATPRGIYAYDIKNDSLWHTNSGAIQLSNIQVAKHGTNTYFGAYALTSHNCKDPMPKYHDHCGWTVLFDEHLNFVFQPDSSKHGYPYRIHGFPIILKDSIHLLAFFETPPNSNDEVEIRLINSNGKTIAKKDLGVSGKLEFNSFDASSNSLLFGHLGADMAWDCSISDEIILEKVETKRTVIVNSNHFKQAMIKNEQIYIVVNKENDKLAIYNNNLIKTSECDLPEIHGFRKLTYGRIGQRNMLCMSNFFNSIFVEIIPNPRYFFRWLLLASLFLILFNVFIFMQFVLTLQLRRRQRMKDTLMRNQLAISKKQLEPHFMLNILNNIGYMFSKEDSKTGQYYFGKYASLLHRGLKYADKVETTLQEELLFIEDYLVLQKMRLNDELDYCIEIEDGIEPELINIPHSLLYTFVENAIKHGLAPKSSDRKLWVHISNTGKKVQILIKDNGVGRSGSVELHTSGSGKGLCIVRDIIQAYNKLYNRSINWYINDLFDDNGDAVGTEVRIVI